MRRYALVLAAIAACVLAGCSGSTATDQRGATRLLEYVPSWLRTSCAETGTRGHLPARVTGYVDSLTCILRADMPAEADYYRYLSVGAMQAAFNSASSAGNEGSPQHPGGCATGTNETGTWSVTGAAAGNFACLVGAGQRVTLVWDDSRTKIMAVASSQYLSEANLYAFWLLNRASIDRSTRAY